MKTQAEIEAALNGTLRCRGVVLWDAAPPPGINPMTHKFSLLDAFETAFCLMRTDCTDEWVVLGPVGTLVVRILPQFIPRVPPGRIGDHYLFIGQICSKDVYIFPRMHNPNLFYMAHGDMFVSGEIANPPVVVPADPPVDDYPPLANVIWQRP